MPKVIAKSTRNKVRIATNVTGEVVHVLIDKSEETLINRYSAIFQSKDSTTFVRSVIASTIRWMQRMINGSETFTLETMDSWLFDQSTMELSMNNPKGALRDHERIYDMSFTQGTLEDYNQGLSSILSSFWYKIDATPPCVVELIACCDLLFTKYHDNVSPAAAAGIAHTNLTPSVHVA